MRIRLLVDDQFGGDGPRGGDEGYVIGTTYDEDEKWYFVVFQGRPLHIEGYFVVREDMVEEI